MDASAFITRDQWMKILERIGFEEDEIRDNRYNQVVHMVSAAKGAEEFYRYMKFSISFYNWILCLPESLKTFKPRSLTVFFYF